MTQNNQIASSLSPSFGLVAKYFVAAIASYIIVSFLLVLNYNSIGGHYFQPKILALVHITTLGWITMIIFGAMFQLIPVVLEVKLFSELLAEIQFWLYLTGVTGLVTAFWSFDTGIHMTLSAAFLAAAMLLFIINITVTMFKVKKWNITGVYLAAALFYLLSTAAAGLLLAVNLGFPFIQGSHLQYLKLHVDVALIGWVAMVIMGVSYKLIPMFTLSHGYSLRNGKIAFVLINAGLLGLTAVMHYAKISSVYYIFIIITASGVMFFLRQIRIIISKRIRKRLDVGMLHSAAAYIIMLFITILGVILAFINFKDLPLEMNLTFIYGYGALFGFFSMLTVGQMYKILPFLVWYHKYSSKVGLEKVPMLREMFSEFWARMEFYLMTAGFVLAAAGFASAISQILLAAFSLMFLSSLLFAYNMIKIFRT